MQDDSRGTLGLFFNLTHLKSMHPKEKYLQKYI